jgi:hypothetical protein
MKTPRLIPLLLVAACAACSAAAWDHPADPTGASPINNLASDAAVTKTDAVTVVASATNADALTGSAKEPDVRAPIVNFPVSCRHDEKYTIDLCSEWTCPDGTIAQSVCNADGNGYYLWEDTQSVCGCPSPAVDAAVSDAVPAPQTPPPAGNDAGTTPPPTIYYDAGRSNDTPPDESPMIIVPTQPDASYPTDVFAPLAADAKITPDVTTVETAPCGCQEPDSAPKTPTIIADALMPDTTPTALQHDAGAPDVTVIPDVIPDTDPVDALPPDAECEGGTTITLSATPIPAPVVQKHCYTRTVYWGVTGCALAGFKVVWSENPPQNGIVPSDNFTTLPAATASWLVHDSNGPGTYYVQVCDSSGTYCSNVLTEVITSPT